tara:strand:+ start:1869 stop:2027 length:159 start_codon:yes stop_codon:yes gene_type:complete
MEEMNKWFERAMDESISEMIETLTERLYDNCTSDIQKVELISIFTDAMEDLE